MDLVTAWLSRNILNNNQAATKPNITMAAWPYIFNKDERIY